MESLKIKCPVCGIFLEVTNSKNEAVKRIVCPNCKKTLAITFRDEKEPEQKTDMAALPVLYYGQMRITLQEGQNQIPLPDAKHLAVRVVRLKDGNCKCLVSTKQDNAIRLNDKYLLLDDEVALSDGDLLRLGNTVLSFNKAFDSDKVVTETPSIPKQKIEQNQKTDSNPIHQSKKSYWWVAVAACVAAMAIMALLGPREENVVVEDALVKKVEAIDTTTQTSGKKNSVKEVGKKVERKVEKPAPINYAQLGDYELEKLANDDVKAQFELGKRWVNRKDSINIVKGTNYLKLASRNGFSEARHALQNVKSTLREAANNGNIHAENLLRVINDD